jgi:hypothetical protein
MAALYWIVESLPHPAKIASVVIDPSRTVARQHFLNFFPLPQGHG